MKSRNPHRSDANESELPLDPSARFLSVELPVPWELLYIGIVTSIAFLAGLALDWPILCLVAKPWPLVALGRYAVHVERELGRPELRGVAYAAWAGAIGDLLLELGARWFLVGAAAFLVGHLFYARAFHRETTAVRWVRALPGLALAIGMVAILARHVSPGLVAGFAVYGLALAAVAFRAADRLDGSELDPRLGLGPLDPRWARLGYVGALTFAVSDAILSIDLFVTPIPGARWLVILTYWAAQAMLVGSLTQGRAILDRGRAMRDAAEAG